MLGAGPGMQPLVDSRGDLILALSGMASAKVLPHEINAGLMELQSNTELLGPLSGVFGEFRHVERIIPSEAALLLTPAGQTFRKGELDRGADQPVPGRR